MSPNPTVISQSKESEEDRSLWKIIILVLFGAGFIFATTYFFNKFLLTADYSRLFFSLLFGGGFLVVMILQIFFIKGRFNMVVVMFLQGITPLIVFYSRIYPSPSLVLIAGSLIFFIFLVFAAVRGQRVLSNSLEIKFFFTARSILPRAVTGLLIFLTIVFYLNYFSWGNFNDELGRVLVGQTLASSQPIVGLVFSDISFNKTVQSFLDVIALNQLRKIPSSMGETEADPAINFQRLPPPEKAEAVRRFSLELKKELEKVVGPLNASAPVTGEVFRITKDYFNGLSAALKSALSLALALAFFFGVKGIAVLLYWFIELVAFVLFKFLLISGFAHITLENRGREFVMLS
ncbi:MAG: hypothetical protein KJI72_00895 [Patescibacteria group bacterium]|nr:hypothetical protein [Patescibacteria group bacterium]